MSMERLWEMSRAYFFALEDMLNEWKIPAEARAFVRAVAILSDGEGEAAVTNKELADEIGVSVRTMARYRRDAIEAMRRANVVMVRYEPGGWEGDMARPTKYYIDWRPVTARAKKILNAKRRP